MNRLLRYLTLPAEITPFERSYLARMNRVALGFFWLHLPVFIGVAALAGTSLARAALLTVAILLGPTLAFVALADRPRLLSSVYAVTAMGMGGVLVYVGQGPLQIEMHFYFFVLIALLAVFANPRVIVVAATTAAAHHLLVWIWLPRAVFNYDASFWTVAVHAAFVVLESVAACFVARSFFDNVIGLEQIVRARTVQVDQRNRDMALILDNVAQGFITIDLHGELGAERSSSLDRWFGAPRPGATLFDYLRPGDAHTQGWFELGLSDLRDALMPPELVIDQLPHQLTAGDRTLRLQYRPIGEPISALLVVVTDITAGKPATGHMLLASRIVDDTLHVEVRDDGRGIDWGRVRAAAEGRGLPATTPDDLVAALFTSGVSTSAAVTDLSGRGVGLDALRVACRELGGDATVRSIPGQGTHLCCSIPLATAAPRRPQSTRIPALAPTPTN